jgi:hypothetical protein
MRRIFVVSLMALSLSSNASAAATCGRWIPQTNGIDWRLCTDAQGKQYCEMRRRNAITRIACP